MVAVPFGWNVVIVGAWNVAILTPDGIRRRLFQLPDQATIEVDVAIDRLAPFRVRHDGLIVVPSSSMLEISTEVLDLPSLLKAGEIGVRALASLPETPLAAAGINVRYRLSDIPDDLWDLIGCSLDDALSDAGHTIKRRAVSRSLLLHPGEVNIELSYGDETDSKLNFNFNLESPQHQELQQWLARANEFFSISQTLLSTMKVQNAEGGEGND